MFTISLALFLLQVLTTKPPTYSVPTGNVTELTTTGNIQNATTLQYTFPDWSASLDNATKKITITDPKNSLNCYSGNVYKSDGTTGGFTYTCIAK